MQNMYVCVCMWTRSTYSYTALAKNLKFGMSILQVIPRKYFLFASFWNDLQIDKDVVIAQFIDPKTTMRLLTIIMITHFRQSQ